MNPHPGKKGRVIWARFAEISPSYCSTNPYLSERLELEMGTENVCRFFKFGFCKFKLNCRYKHVTKVCDDEKCNQETCQNRHPRICKYYVNFGSCKLGSNCAYAHKIQRKEENGRLEQKLDELARIISGKDDVIRKLENKIKLMT